MAELSSDQSSKTTFDLSSKSQLRVEFAANLHQEEEEEESQDPPKPSADFVRIPSSDSDSPGDAASSDANYHTCTIAAACDKLEALPRSHPVDDKKGVSYPCGFTVINQELHDSNQGCQESPDACVMHGQLINCVCSPHGEDKGCEIPNYFCNHDQSKKVADRHVNSSDHTCLGLNNDLCPYSSECSSTVSILSNAASLSETEAEESDMDMAPVDTRWTDAKHRSYLSFMEANFVRNLYNRKYCLVDVCGVTPCHVGCECAASPAEFWSYHGGHMWPTCLTWSLKRNSWVNHFQHRVVNHSKYHGQASNERPSPLADCSEGEEVDSPMTWFMDGAPLTAGETHMHEATEKATNHSLRSATGSRKRGSWSLDEERSATRQKADR